MAERDETLPCAKGDWTELTASDVSTISIQNQGPMAVLLKGTAGSVKPSLDSPAGCELKAGDTLYLGAETIPLASFFSGVPGVNRVWAYTANGAKVWVSHP